MKKKNSNPLYVVTKKGKIVEKAKNPMDLIVKKFGLEPVRDVLKNIIALILSNIKNYPQLKAATEFFNRIITEVKSNVEYVSRLINPLMANFK